MTVDVGLDHQDMVLADREDVMVAAYAVLAWKKDLAFAQEVVPTLHLESSLPFLYSLISRTRL